MNLVRAVVFASSALLLAGGYLSSQVAFLSSLDPQNAQATADYAKSIDTPIIKGVAMVIFVACIVLAFLPQKEAQE